MTPEERERVLDALPSEFELPRASPPPEGDCHFNAKAAAKDTLSGYFQRIGRRVCLACELPIYYPAERVFAPDLIAVLDVEVKERAYWAVSAEGKGIDLALELVWGGSSRKDLDHNVTRYASLGIPEYFVFDRRRLRLRGFRLDAGSTRYQAIVPQEGRLTSTVLGLEVALEGDRLRFFHGLAPLPETRELLARLGAMVGKLEARIEETEQQLDEEKQRADEAERKLAAALAELERLKRERG